jgi:AMP-binding enzyme
MDDPCSTGVGKLCPNVEAKVVKSDGREVGFGERGEFLVRGPNVFGGYWRNPKATRNTLTPDGWLRTGDVGYIESNGVFYIVDREKVRRGRTRLSSFHANNTAGANQGERLPSGTGGARRPASQVRGRRGRCRDWDLRVCSPFACIRCSAWQLTQRTETRRNTHAPTSCRPARA